MKNKDDIIADEEIVLASRNVSRMNSKRSIWKLYFDERILIDDRLNRIDLEQERKLLYHAPTNVLRFNYFLRKDYVLLAIYTEKLCPLSKLDPKKDKDVSLALKRLLSIFNTCCQLQEELLTIDPLFLHPDLIYFDQFHKAKILTMPFKLHSFSAGKKVQPAENSWLFYKSNDTKEMSNVNLPQANTSGELALIKWISDKYALDRSIRQMLKPLALEGKHKSLTKCLEKQIKKQKNINDYSKEENDTNSINDSRNSKEDASEYKTREENNNTDKNINITTENLKLDLEDDKPLNNETQTGFLTNLVDKIRSRYFPDFSETEKTTDLPIEDPFFRMACLSEGLPGTEEENLGQRAFILVDEFLIGRDANKVDFWIESLNVSRLHARIIRRQGSFFIEDLGSRNSTLLDGKKLNKYREYLLPDKCRLTFADKAFYFEASS